ncbi:GIP, partial [Symbiodinium sp. KB8]
VLQEDLEADIPSDDSPSACIVKTCYADDIAKSEELAREWLEQKKFSPQQCLELLESVGLDFRANRRGGIHGNEERVQALAVGQYVRGHMCGVTNATKHRPMFVKYLVSFVREHNPDVDPSLYLIIATDPEGKDTVKGTLGLYVDDFLLAGSMSIITDAIQQIRSEWKTSEPEFCGSGHDGRPLKFLGIQIFWNDGAYYLNQEDFVRDLLQRRGFHADAGGLGGAGPMSNEAPPDEPQEISVEALRSAQAAVGELLWLALKCRADLAFCARPLSVWCARYPRFVARKADEVFHYLSRTVTLGLKYSKVDPMPLGGDSQLRFKRSVTVLEAYKDASFAAGCESDETARSHSGAVVVLADSPVMWMTQRQTTVALSTAEAELNAALEGTTVLQSVAPIVSVLLGINEDGLSKALYIDSVSACSIISVVAGAWRTRHLRIRAAGLRSLLNSGYLVVAHLKGEHMLADMLTKLMNGGIFVNLKQMRQMAIAPSTHLVSDAARAAAAAVAILVATTLQGCDLVHATSSTSLTTTSSTTRWFDRTDIGFFWYWFSSWSQSTKSFRRCFKEAWSAVGGDCGITNSNAT